MFSAPTSTAPAASSRRTSAASRAAGGRRARSSSRPAWCRPATSNRFFTAKGTPASGSGARRGWRVDLGRRAQRPLGQHRGEGVDARLGGGDAVQAGLHRARALTRPARTASAIAGGVDSAVGAHSSPSAPPARRRCPIRRRRAAEVLPACRHRRVQAEVHRTPVRCSAVICSPAPLPRRSWAARSCSGRASARRRRPAPVGCRTLGHRALPSEAR